MFKFNYKILALCFMAQFGLFLLISSGALAQGKKVDTVEDLKKPMPEIPVMPQEEFAEASRIVAKKPYSKNALAYSMRIPKDWTEGVDKSSVNFLLSDKLFLELGSYYAPPTISGRSRIVIEALNMEANLTAEQWYIKYILEGGYTTEGLVVHNENKVESLMVVMEGDFSYYLRSLIMLNGRNIIILKYYVPVSQIQEQAIIQSMVVSSFRLTYPQKRKYGNLAPYRFLDIAEVKYPEEWEIFSKPIRDMNRLNVTILNTYSFGGKSNVASKKNNAMEGKLDVTVVSSAVKNTLIEEIAEYKEQIESKGMLIGDRIPENYQFTYSDKMDFALTEVYRGLDNSDNASEYELWFTVMVGGNYYYFVMLLTPSRNDMFGVWAENVESYKLIVSKFKPMVGAFLERD